MLNKITKEKLLIGLLILGAVFYFIGIVWVNFNGRQWYSFDIYSDTLVAKLMYENKSLFPENWIFGNQYYVIATPVLTALMYGICHNSVLSLSIASTLMMIAILVCFAWSMAPFLKKKYIIVGEFCLSGAVILGNSASSYVNGLCYFYTMASFYACYIFVIFFTLGLFFRIRQQKNTNKVALIFSLFFAFALGMQSLRQTLVLYLPLIALCLFLYILKRGNFKSSLYSIVVIASNILGYFTMKFIPAKSSPIISEIALPDSFASFIDNIQITTSEFLTITGLRFCTYGLKWLPLFVIAVIFVFVVAIATFQLIANKDTSVNACALIFCWISLAAVYAVGILLFRVRAIYFFVWYLLVAFSFMYLIKMFQKNLIHTSLISLLLFCGGVNFIFNFAPDVLSYITYNKTYQEATDALLEEGIDCVYYDIHTSPRLAVYSKDKIVSGSVFLDPNGKSGGLMHPTNYLTPIDVFENAEEFNSYLVFSNWTFDYLESKTTKEYQKKLFSNLTFVKTVTYGTEELTYYKFSPEILNVDYLKIN